MGAVRRKGNRVPNKIRISDDYMYFRDHRFKPQCTTGMASSFIYVDVPKELEFYFKNHNDQELLKKMTGFYWDTPVFMINHGRSVRYHKMEHPVYFVGVDMNDPQTKFRVRITANDEFDFQFARTWIKEAEVLNHPNKDGTKYLRIIFDYLILGENDLSLTDHDIRLPRKCMY